MKATVRFLVTALVLMLVALPLTASAATLNGQGQSTIADVQAKYAEGMTTPDVYSLEVSWGAMEFTCTRTGRNEWNPAEHKYTENTTYVWTANGNTVTVKNHSNRNVTVTFSYEKAAGYDSITGEFDVATKALEAGEVGNVDGAAGVTATLTLSGSLASNVTTSTKVGTVKISVE